MLRDIFLGIQKRGFFLLLLVMGFLSACSSDKTPSNNDDPPTPKKGSALEKALEGLTYTPFTGYKIPIVQPLLYSISGGNFADYFQSQLGLVFDTSLSGSAILDNNGTPTSIVGSSPDITGKFKDGFNLPTNLDTALYLAPIPFTPGLGMPSGALDGKNFCLAMYDKITNAEVDKVCGVYSSNVPMIDLANIKSSKEDVLLYFMLTDDKEYIYLPPVSWRTTTKVFSISSDGSAKNISEQSKKAFEAILKRAHSIL